VSIKRSFGISVDSGSADQSQVDAWKSVRASRVGDFCLAFTTAVRVSRNAMVHLLVGFAGDGRLRQKSGAVHPRAWVTGRSFGVRGE
jgi:hypothetical protein